MCILGVGLYVYMGWCLCDHQKLINFFFDKRDCNVEVQRQGDVFGDGVGQSSQRRMS